MIYINYRHHHTANISPVTPHSPKLAILPALPVNSAGGTCVPFVVPVGNVALGTPVAAAVTTTVHAAGVMVIVGTLVLQVELALGSCVVQRLV